MLSELRREASGFGLLVPARQMPLTSTAAGRGVCLHCTGFEAGGHGLAWNE